MGGTAESTGEPLPEACACLEMGDDACGARICDHVALECEGSCMEEEVEIDEDALTCVLTALRDRTPGLVSASTYEAGGQYSSSTRITILPDGTALSAGSGASDLSWCTESVSLAELRPPSYFDDCLGKGLTRQRIDCVRLANEKGLATCVEGECYSDDG